MSEPMNIRIVPPPGGKVQVSDVLIGESRFNQTDVFDADGKLVERTQIRCTCECCTFGEES